MIGPQRIIDQLEWEDASAWEPGTDEAYITDGFMEAFRKEMIPQASSSPRKTIRMYKFEQSSSEEKCKDGITIEDLRCSKRQRLVAVWVQV